MLLPTAADPFFAEAVVVLAAGTARDESVWEVVLTQRRDGVGGSRGVDGHYELRTDVCLKKNSVRGLGRARRTSRHYHESLRDQVPRPGARKSRARQLEHLSTG